MDWGKGSVRLGAGAVLVPRTRFVASSRLHSNLLIAVVRCIACFSVARVSYRDVIGTATAPLRMWSKVYCAEAEHLKDATCMQNNNICSAG